MPEPNALHGQSESGWTSHPDVAASPFYEQMNADRCAVVRLLRDDLYRLDDDQSEQAGGPYDSAVRWRYAAPGHAFRVTLWFGEQNLCGLVVRKDGTFVASTTHADVHWLDEVLP